MPEDKGFSSPLSREMAFLWPRYYLTRAHLEVVDGILKHYDDMYTPKPTRAYLYGVCLDMLVLDLLVCWDKNGTGSIPSVASRLGSMNDKSLAEYIGSDAPDRLDKARSATPKLTDLNAGISSHLDTLKMLRNKRIAHLDTAHQLKMPELPKEGIEAIQSATKEALTSLDGVTGSLGVAGGDILRIAGENLVLDLLKVRRF